MKVLLLLSESWNDKTAPNNNMTNWFQNFNDLEIWTVSGSAEIPDNKVCQHYFLIGENQMLRSLISKECAGKRYNQEGIMQPVICETDISSNKKIKHLLSSECARLARDMVWRYGRYDLVGLKQFVDECKPDVVFSQRRGSVKMCRLEKQISELTDAPIVAYTGDDEYSLHQFSLSPIFWIRRFWTRSWLKQTIPMYKLFYSQSERQMREFEHEFGVKTKFLVKCGEFVSSKIHRSVNEVIQIVYAGKLYCNRWKTLSMVAKAIHNTNNRCGKTRIQLNIYTGDKISGKQDRVLNDGINSIIHGSVPASQLPEIFSNSDIVLHVESFDIHNRLLTQDSFSTKVMDCLSSGCAVMAVCWEGHAALQYLKNMDAAIVASNNYELQKCIDSIVEKPEKICEYAEKAYKCGLENHRREQIQQMIIHDFNEVGKEC